MPRAFDDIVARMQALVTVLFLLAALINLGPVMGAFSTARMEALYGIPIEGPNLEILMRHRAVLFGIVGTLLAVAAFHPPLRTVAFAAGLVSMVSFLAVAAAVGEFNGEIQRVIWIDVAGIVFLVLGYVLGMLGA